MCDSFAGFKKYILAFYDVFFEVMGHVAQMIPPTMLYAASEPREKDAGMSLVRNVESRRLYLT